MTGSSADLGAAAKRVKAREYLLGIPVGLLATPREGNVLVDRWWCVQDGCAMFWRGANNRRGWSPQCNHDERLAKSLIAGRYKNATAAHIEVAYVGQWDPEWGYVLNAELLAAGREMGGEQ